MCWPHLEVRATWMTLLSLHKEWPHWLNSTLILFWTRPFHLLFNYTDPGAFITCWVSSRTKPTGKSSAINKSYTKSDWSRWMVVNGLVMVDCYYFDTIVHINWYWCCSVSMYFTSTSRGLNPDINTNTQQSQCWLLAIFKCSLSKDCASRLALTKITLEVLPACALIDWFWPCGGR